MFIVAIRENFAGDINSTLAFVGLFWLWHWHLGSNR